MQGPIWSARSCGGGGSRRGEHGRHGGVPGGLCEKNSACQRGYKHGGFGSKCSFKKRKVAAETKEKWEREHAKARELGAEREIVAQRYASLKKEASTMPPSKRNPMDPSRTWV